MRDSTLFPTASNRDTVAYCWRQMRPDRTGFALCWSCVTAGTLATAVAGPVIFAMLLARLASLPRHASLWHTFGGLLIAYAVSLVASTASWRVAVWTGWGAILRSFGRAITDGYDHLLSLSHRWHTDRPSGEVISTLETFSWAFVELVDTMTWGVLRSAITVLGAIAVMAFFIWPVALVMVVLVLSFGGVLAYRMRHVVAAEKGFTDTHSQATGVIADTIANLTTVRTQAGERDEQARVRRLVRESMEADFRGRRIFTTTRLQMETSMSLLNWVAIGVGVALALHHVVAAGPVYLVLFYATFVGGSLEEAFDYVRLLARAVGRCAKMVGIAQTPPEICDRQGAGSLVASGARVELHDVVFSYRRDAPLFDHFDLCIQAGEHVGLVGPSGSGKTTLTKLLLRFMDIDAGCITIDGQDISVVTQASLRRHVAYVPQDPQMLHRTIAENICYGAGDTWGGPPEMALVASVGRAAHVEEFVERLPDGYDTVVGERGLKLSGGQRQRVAIAQAMAKRAPLLLLDEATSALDSESELMVQEALWNLMADSTALVVAHRLATIARLDRIVVLDQGRIVEQGTHAELLAAGPSGVYGRLWEHQSGGFLAA